MLSKSLSTSVKRARLHAVLGELAEFAQALYPLLVAHADDYGREPADPLTVKLQVDPTSPRTDDEFEQVLQALEDVGLIERYQSGRHHVLQIVDFDAHQAGLHKRTASRFDPPPSWSTTNCDATEREIETRIANALRDGSLRVDGLEIVQVDQQVRIGNCYLDIVARTSQGPPLVIEVKRQRVSRAALRQVRGYVDLLPGAIPAVLGFGLAGDLELPPGDVLVGVFDDALAIETVASFTVNDRYLTFREVISTRARAELNLTEQNLTTERKNALRAKARPVEKPKVTTLAAMIRADILPLGLADDGDLAEAAKQRAAKLHMPYTSSAIYRALASARAQVSKRGHA